ncbi:ABC transporter ATP-binding protein [Dermabacteraceae bacterium TAE3-ERU27]|nr:ABC transporter ATP-binding protein [Dermabacteraceae bacterium TAE3-ERU27]
MPRQHSPQPHQTGGAAPVISLHGVSFQYREQSSPTLHDINLTVRRGEKIAIIGQSGCGKSTLVHILNGMIPHRYRGELSGEIDILGLDPRKVHVAELGTRVGTVLQDSDGQFVGLSVAEDIAFSLENQAVPVNQMREYVVRAAQAVGIADRLEHTPQNLSGGQKQRVAIAGVLVDDVDVLLCDEPLASLDPASGKSTIALLDKLNRTEGKTVIIVEHRLEDVLDHGVDRIVVMAEGRIIADAPPAQILASDLLPRHGIRMPLYLSALRLAGQQITAADRPEHVATVRFDAPALRAWYAQQAPSPATPEEASAQVPALRVSDLRCTLGTTPVLKGVSFTVRRGEMLALLGNNGAGKSTLARTICGFAPYAGSIELAGEDAASLTIAERGRRVGFVLQNPNHMISQPTVAAEVALSLTGGKGGELNEAQRARMRETLEVCGLWPMRNWPIGALSYGQKKRLTVAAILVSSPDLLILDEPTAGQDWAHYTEIMEFLRRLNEQGHTILLITHDMHLALEYTPRVLVLSEGGLLADAPCSQVLSDPSLTQRASLVTTSLYELARRADIADEAGFAEAFIGAERRANVGGKQ